MQYTQNITLDVTGKARYKYVKAKQGDNESRYLNITLMSGTEKLTPSTESGDEAVFRFEKPDKKSGFNPGIVNDDGTVTIELTKQVLAVEGTVKADVSIMNGGSVLSTATFYIQVEKAPISGDQTVSSNEFLYLVEKIEEVNDAIRRANEAAEKSENVVSPIATVEQTETGATITIDDVNGTTTANVYHGNDGYTPKKGVDYFTEDDKREMADNLLFSIHCSVNLQTMRVSDISHSYEEIEEAYKQGKFVKVHVNILGVGVILTADLSAINELSNEALFYPIVRTNLGVGFKWYAIELCIGVNGSYSTMSELLTQ